MGDLGLEFGQDAKILVREIDDRAAGAAGQGFAVTLGTDGQGTAAAGTLKGLRLDAGVRFPSDRHDRAQARQFQVVEAHLFADEHQRWRFAVIESGEHLAWGLQVHHRGVVTRSDPNRQLAFAGDATGGFDVGDLKSAALEGHALAGAQFGKGRQWFGRLDQEGDRVVAQRFAQPAAALVIEQQVPFVPDALAIA